MVSPFFLLQGGDRETLWKKVSMGRIQKNRLKPTAGIGISRSFEKINCCKFHGG